MLPPPFVSRREMSFLQKRKEQMKIRSLGDMKRSGRVKTEYNPELFVYGPEEFDCLKYKWSRTEVLGIIGDSGCGKTEVVLAMMKGILKSNPDSCAIYVSLEMTDQELAQRWFKMTEGEEELADRLYIVSRYDDDGKSRDVSMKWIKKQLETYQETIGDVSCFVVDHIHCLGENDPSTLNSIMVTLKEMAVATKSLAIALAQVNKSSGGKGEIPLDSDSVLACSQFKYISSNIIQIHRPILRLEGDAGISVLGWGYTKVREASKEDTVKRGQNRLLAYDQYSRNLRQMSLEEQSKFKLYYNMLLEMKSAEEKSKSYCYNITKKVKGANGKEVEIKEIFSGDNGD